MQHGEPHRTGDGPTDGTLDHPTDGRLFVVLEVFLRDDLKSNKITSSKKHSFGRKKKETDLHD